jgi:hypothetical protein
MPKAIDPATVPKQLQRQLLRLALRLELAGTHRPAPRPLAEPATGFVLGVDRTTGSFGLLRLGYPSLRLENEVALDLVGAPLDPDRTLSTAVAWIDQELLGQPAERAPTMLIYQSIPGVGGGGGDAVPASGTARLFIGIEQPDGRSLELMQSAELSGAETPYLAHANLVFVENRQQVILLGESSASAELHQAWRLDLQSGQWVGPYPVALPARLSGYAVEYDSALDQILVLGGQVVIPGPVTHPGAEPVVVKQTATYVINPSGFSVVEKPTTGLPTDLGRSDPGTFLDVEARQVYLAGGNGDQGALGDLWRLDLLSGVWSLQATGDASGPAGLVAPLVVPDVARRLVWVVDSTPRPASEGMTLWAARPDGRWLSSVVGGFLATPAWPVSDVYLLGKGYRYPWVVPADEAWPGTLVLAELMAAEPALGLTVSNREGEPFGAGAPDPGGLATAGALCLSGTTCYLNVQPANGAALMEGLAFTLAATPAVLSSEPDVMVKSEITGMEVLGDTLAVATHKGLLVYQAGRPPELVGELSEHRQHSGHCSHSGHGPQEVTGVAVCGGQLCLSRSDRQEGLWMVSLQDPTSPVVLGAAPLAGPGADVASEGSTAYVAEGHHGIGVYDLSRPEQIVAVQRLNPGWKIVSVAARRGLVVAGSDHRDLYLYSLEDGTTLLAQMRSDRKIGRLRFMGDQLWVQDEHARWVEVWDLSDPAQPVRLGEHQDADIGYFHLRFRSDEAFGFDRRTLKVYGLQATP